MDSRTIQKINHLAKSLKKNRLAASMDEAVEMAKQMLTKDASGSEKTSELLAEMESELAEEKKELHGVETEAKALNTQAEQSKDRHEESSSLSHGHTKEFEDLKKDITETKEEIEALDQIKKDAEVDAQKEQEAYTSEEYSKKDLPGEKHERKKEESAEYTKEESAEDKSEESSEEKSSE